MKKLFIYLLLLLSSSPAFCEIVVTQLKSVPPGIPYKGKPVEIREIIDSEGKHVVILSKVELKDFGERNYRSEIYACKYSYASNGIERKWEIKDFNPSPLVSLDFVGKLQVTDVDHDGVAETLFSYEMAPDGLDPITLKMMFHYKDVKYAIRGEVPQQASGKFDKKVASSVEQLPAVAKDYVHTAWDELLKLMTQR